jgi:glucose-6-phosphate 1-dehydrogenase
MTAQDGTTTLLILGADGDLTRRLLLPGLATLLRVESDRDVIVVGSDRRALDQDEWRQLVTEAFDSVGLAEETMRRTVGDSSYIRADVLDKSQLGDLVAGLGGPLVIYFALPPQVTAKLCDLLSEIELPPRTRLALEKPFGYDEASARALNEQLRKVVPEDRIHRIDHFLGTSTVLNLLGLRFANRMFAPVWSAEAIERVEVLYDEDLALEGRAGYYDRAGALVDMLQSHLLIVLAVFAMENPATVEAVELRDMIAQALRATRVWGGDPTHASRRARYTAGRVGGKDVPSYVDEEGVDPARDTETLAEVAVEIRNRRWAGVPFLLRRLSEDAARRCMSTSARPGTSPTASPGRSGRTHCGSGSIRSRSASPSR